MAALYRCRALCMQGGSTCCERLCCIAAILASSRSELKRKPSLSSEETLPLCELLKRQQEKAPANFSGWRFSNYSESVRWQAVQLGPVGEEEDDKVFSCSSFAVEGSVGTGGRSGGGCFWSPHRAVPSSHPCSPPHQAVPTNPVPWLETVSTSLQLSLRLVLFF